MASTLTWRLLIHLQSILYWMREADTVSFFFSLYTQYSHHDLLKTLSFLRMYIFDVFVKNGVAVAEWFSALFCGSMSAFVLSPCCFCHYGSAVQFEIRCVALAALLFGWRLLCFGYSEHFYCFPTGFIISFSSTVTMSLGFWWRLAWVLWIVLGSMAMFTAVLLIH